MALAVSNLLILSGFRPSATATEGKRLSYSRDRTTQEHYRKSISLFQFALTGKGECSVGAHLRMRMVPSASSLICFPEGILIIARPLQCRVGTHEKLRVPAGHLIALRRGLERVGFLFRSLGGRMRSKDCRKQFLLLNAAQIEDHRSVRDDNHAGKSFFNASMSS
jgi:hypothetical protein